MPSYQYRDFHVKDKTVGDFNIEIPIPGKDGLYIESGPWITWRLCDVTWVLLLFYYCIIQCGAYHTPKHFLHHPHNRHPIARPWGCDMGCLLWVPNLLHVLCLSLKCCMPYGYVLDRVITAPECTWFAIQNSTFELAYEDFYARSMCRGQGQTNYIPQFLWDIITCQYPLYQLMAKHSSYECNCRSNCMSNIVGQSKAPHR